MIFSAPVPFSHQCLNRRNVQEVIIYSTRKFLSLDEIFIDALLCQSYCVLAIVCFPFSTKLQPDILCLPTRIFQISCFVLWFIIWTWVVIPQIEETTHNEITIPWQCSNHPVWIISNDLSPGFLDMNTTVIRTRTFALAGMRGFLIVEWESETWIFWKYWHDATSSQYGNLENVK